MHRYLSTNKKAYYAAGLTVFKAPVATRREGGESITMGFPVCEISEWVEGGEAAAQNIASLLCGKDEE